VAQSITELQLSPNYLFSPTPSGRTSVTGITNTTNGTSGAVQTHSSATGGTAYSRIRVRVRITSSAQAGGQAYPALQLKVSTTSAMTTPEVVALWPGNDYTTAATNETATFELFGWSNVGFQYSQLFATGLANATSTYTYDAYFDVCP